MIDRSKANLFRSLKSQADLQLLVLPAVIMLILFSYVPMWGIIMAFQDFDVFKGFSGSEWVGLKHFKALFADRAFPRIVLNTLLISAQRLLFVFPAPIVLALILNEVRSPKFKKVTQTISYLPHFISWVIVAGFCFSLLAVDGGPFNELLLSLGWITEPINFLSTPGLFQPILITANIWKSTGFSAIVYLAAMAGIDPTLYEAAEMDGLNRLGQIFKITLPLISPIIGVFFVLAIAGILNAGFEDILLLTRQMTNAVLREKAEVIDTYVFRIGLRSGRFSYATAAGLFRATVSVTLLWVGNRIARATGRAAIW